MKKKIIPDVANDLVVTEKKEYYTKSADRKLKFLSMSSTLGNFRSNEEEKAHIPLLIFQN